MNEIYKEFVDLFNEELNDLLIGYPQNETRMAHIMNLVNYIFYINNALDPKSAAVLAELLK